MNPGALLRLWDREVMTRGRRCVVNRQPVNRAAAEWHREPDRQALGGAGAAGCVFRAGLHELLDVEGAAVRVQAPVQQIPAGRYAESPLSTPTNIQRQYY